MRSAIYFIPAGAIFPEVPRAFLRWRSIDTTAGAILLFVFLIEPNRRINRLFSYFRPRARWPPLPSVVSIPSPNIERDISVYVIHARKGRSLTLRSPCTSIDGISLFLCAWMPEGFFLARNMLFSLLPPQTVSVSGRYWACLNKDTDPDKLSVLRRSDSPGNDVVACVEEWRLRSGHYYRK